MQVRYGSYVGNGSTRSITGAGTISLLIIRARASRAAIIRPASFVGDGAWVASATATAATGLVTSIDADGFSLGTDVQVNETGVTFDWLAIKAEAGDSYQGSYTGNGADNRAISGMGCDPAFAIIVSQSAQLAVWRSSTMAGELTHTFINASSATNAIQALNADGIEIGTLGRVNTAAVTYHVFACVEIAGVFDVFTYTGNAVDNRSITGIGFQPDWSSTQKTGLQMPLRTSGHAGDQSGQWTNAAYNTANQIQAHEADGIQVGNAQAVNENASTFHGFAFRAPVDVVAPTPSLGVSLSLGKALDALLELYGPVPAIGMSLALGGPPADALIVFTVPVPSMGVSLSLAPGMPSPLVPVVAPSPAIGVSIARRGSAVRISAPHILSDAMRSAVARNTHRAIEVFEVDFPSGTIRGARVPYSSAERGHFTGKVTSFGDIQTIPSNRDGSLGATETTIELNDTDREIAQLSESVNAHRLVGSPIRRYLAHPEVAFADWCLLFEGIITKPPAFPSEFMTRLTARVDDAALEGPRPRKDWTIDRVSWPSAHPDEMTKSAPLAYGRVSAGNYQSGPGFRTTLYVDTMLFRYALCAGRAKSITTLYVDDVQTPSLGGATWTMSYVADRRGRIWTIVTFTADQADAVITWDGEGYEATGDGSGALITDPADQLAHLLTNFHLGDWRNGAAWLPTNAKLGDSLTSPAGVVKTFLTPRVAATSPAWVERIGGYDVVEGFCNNFGLRAYWSAGRLEFAVEDVNVQPYTGKRVDWDNDVQSMAIEPDDITTTPSVRVEHVYSVPQSGFQSSFGVALPDLSTDEEETLSLLWSSAT